MELYIPVSANVHPRFPLVTPLARGRLDRWLASRLSVLSWRSTLFDSHFCFGESFVLGVQLVLRSCQGFKSMPKQFDCHFLSFLECRKIVTLSTVYVQKDSVCSKGKSRRNTFDLILCGWMLCWPCMEINHRSGKQLFGVFFVMVVKMHSVNGTTCPAESETHLTLSLVVQVVLLKISRTSRQQLLKSNCRTCLLATVQAFVCHDEDITLSLAQNALPCSWSQSFKYKDSNVIMHVKFHTGNTVYYVWLQTSKQQFDSAFHQPWTSRMPAGSLTLFLPAKTDELFPRISEKTRKLPENRSRMPTLLFQFLSLSFPSLLTVC